MLKKIIYAIVIIAVLFVVTGLFLPHEVHVQRSTIIERPAATVFTILNDYRHFQAWSPWADRDPDARYSISGPATGVGARLSWSGDPRLVGTGWQEIVSSDPYRRIGMQLFFEGQGTADSYFLIEERGQGVELTWGFDTDLLEGQSGFGGVLARYFGLFFDRWIGADYEQGLARLKDYVESLPPADFADLDVAIVDVEPQDILFVRVADLPQSQDLESGLAAAYAEISTFMSGKDIERTGQPMTITRSGAGGELSLEAAVPADTASAESSGHVRIGHSPSGRAIRVVHRGPPAGLRSAYENLAAWMAVRGIEEGRISWEQYVSDPASTAPDKVIIHIYVLIEDAS
jgi:effector-binding domain-containing protein